MSVPRYLRMPVDRFPEYVDFLKILIKLNKGAPCPDLEQALPVRSSVCPSVRLWSMNPSPV